MRRSPRRRPTANGPTTVLAALGVAMAVLTSACASSDDPVSVAATDTLAAVETTLPAIATTPTIVDATTTTTPPPTTTTTPPPITTTTTTTTTTTSTTVPPTTVLGPSSVAGTLDLTAPQLTVGTSVEGRPIVAERYGTLGGRRVLVIGVIHGNEDDGVAIVDQLRQRAIDGTAPLEAVELWLVESMNPDGQAAQVRQNANGVDLNRNFPHEWGPIGQPGDSQFAGTGAASEPETQAMVNFISQLRPDIAIWYHQDANLVIPSTGRDGRIRERYATLTDLPLATCCGGGGIYTGIAATWARNELERDSDAVAFIVELPGSLVPEQVTAHATAVLTIAVEG